MDPLSNTPVPYQLGFIYIWECEWTRGFIQHSRRQRQRESEGGVTRSLLLVQRERETETEDPSILGFDWVNPQSAAVDESFRASQDAKEPSNWIYAHVAVSWGISKHVRRWTLRRDARKNAYSSFYLFTCATDRWYVRLNISHIAYNDQESCVWEKSRGYVLNKSCSQFTRLSQKKWVI